MGFVGLRSGFLIKMMWVRRACKVLLLGFFKVFGV
jgi:hypothetical protein